jgi:hypothetical protein
MRHPLLFTLALLTAPPALAVDRAESPARMSTAPQVGNMDTSEFLAFHDAVRRDIESGRYGKLDARTRDTIDAQQRIIESRLDGGRQLEELNDDARLAVFNAHERVVALLNDDEAQRTICRREHQVGSHRPRVVCLTERDRDLAAQQNRLRHMYKGQSID